MVASLVLSAVVAIAFAKTCPQDAAGTCSQQQDEDIQSLLQTSLVQDIQRHKPSPKGSPTEAQLEWLHTAVAFLDDHLATSQLWRAAGVNSVRARLSEMEHLTPEAMEEAGPINVAAAALKKIGMIHPITHTMFAYIQMFGKPVNREKMVKDFPNLQHINPGGYALWKFLSQHWHKVLEHGAENSMKPGDIGVCAFMSLADGESTEKQAMTVAMSNLMDVVKMTAEDPAAYFGP